MNAIINKTGNVIQKIIWGILVAMFGILSIFNILGTTKIDIKVNDYKEYAEYSLNNILMIILYVELFLQFCILLTDIQNY